MDYCQIIYVELSEYNDLVEEGAVDIYSFTVKSKDPSPIWPKLNEVYKVMAYDASSEYFFGDPQEFLTGDEVLVTLSLYEEGNRFFGSLTVVDPPDISLSYNIPSSWNNLIESFRTLYIRDHLRKSLLRSVDFLSELLGLEILVEPSFTIRESGEVGICFVSDETVGNSVNVGNTRVINIFPIGIFNEKSTVETYAYHSLPNITTYSCKNIPQLYHLCCSLSKDTIFSTPSKKDQGGYIH